MAWYRTGTIQLTQGSDVVTGTGTRFIENVRFGDILKVGDKLLEIKQVMNDEQLRLFDVHTEPTISGAAFAVIRSMTNATNYDLMSQMDRFLEERQISLEQFTAWVDGEADGGPNGDGKYPLNTRYGETRLVKCPARMELEADIDYTDTVNEVQADVQALQDLLVDYIGGVRSVQGKAGIVTLNAAEIGAQPANDKLSRLALLDLAVGEFPISLGENMLGKAKASLRGQALIAAETREAMRSILGVTPGSGGGVSSGGAVGRRVAIIGTSLCQLSSYATATEISNTSRSWVGWARTLLNGAICTPIWQDMGLYPGWEVLGNVGTPRGFRGLNAGVSSDRAEGILARAPYLVENVDCDIVIVDCGPNDVSTKTKEEVQSLREQVVDYFLSNGKIVVLLTLPVPSTSYYPAGGMARRSLVWVNQKSREFVLSRENCYLFDWTEQMIDFTSEYGNPKEGFTVDGIHFSPKGAFAVGKALAAFLERLIPPAPRRVWSPEDVFSLSQNPLGNMPANPFMTGTAGTVDTGGSGQVSTSYRGGMGSGSGSVAFSKTPRADGRGEWQVITVTPDASAAGTAWFRLPDFAHTLPEGSWVEASVEIEVDGWDGFHAINLTLRDLGASGVTAQACKPYNTGFPNTSESWKGLLIIPAFQVKAGSMLRWRVEITTVPGTAGTGTVRVGSAECRQVDDPKLLVNAR